MVQLLQIARQYLNLVFGHDQAYWNEHQLQYVSLTYIFPSQFGEREGDTKGGQKDTGKERRRIKKKGRKSRREERIREREIKKRKREELSN